MSLKAYDWAWKQKAPLAQRHLLLALADHANTEDAAWPGVKRLAEMCQMDERNVRRYLRALEASGLIALESKTDGGGHETNRYRLCMEGNSTPLTPGSIAPLTGGNSTPGKSSRRGVKAAAPGGNNVRRRGVKLPKPGGKITSQTVIEPGTRTGVEPEYAGTAVPAPATPPKKQVGDPTVQAVTDAVREAGVAFTPDGRIAKTIRELANLGRSVAEMAGLLVDVQTGQWGNDWLRDQSPAYILGRMDPWLMWNNEGRRNGQYGQRRHATDHP